MNISDQPQALTQALAEPTRRAILQTLLLEAKTVSQIVQETHRKQPNISNHLAKMREQGILRHERTGRYIYYSLATPFADILLRLEDFTHFRQKMTDNKGKVSISEDILQELRESWLEAILQGKEEQSSNLVNTFLEANLPLESIYTEVFQWALQRVGDQQVDGEINIAEEHRASAITERMMARVAQFYTRITRNGFRAVCGCVADNWHDIGLRMLSDSLTIRGWETHFLGANVPSSSFLEITKATNPHLVVISLSLQSQISEAQSLIEKLQRLQAEKKRERKYADFDFRIVVGGNYFLEEESFVNFLGVDNVQSDLSSFLEMVKNRFENIQKYP